MPLPPPPQIIAATIWLWRRSLSFVCAVLRTGADGNVRPIVSVNKRRLIAVVLTVQGALLRLQRLMTAAAAASASVVRVAHSDQSRGNKKSEEEDPGEAEKQRAKLRTTARVVSARIIPTLRSAKLTAQKSVLLCALSHPQNLTLYQSKTARPGAPPLQLWLASISLPFSLTPAVLLCCLRCCLLPAVLFAACGAYCHGSRSEKTAASEVARRPLLMKTCFLLLTVV